MQKITLKLSESMSIEIDGQDAREIWPIAAFWQSLPTQCPVCRSTLSIEYRTPQSYKYYILKCSGTPAHSVNLGQRTDTNQLYFDRSKPWELFGRGGDVHLSDPPAATPIDQATGQPVDNSPDSVRGRMIKKIKQLADDLRDRNVPHERPDLGKLGGLSTPELTNLGTYLAERLNDPQRPMRRANT
jgi:hypothetical protein